MGSVYLSMGSNVGNREANLREAIRLLSANDGVRIIKSSRIYETKPVGDLDQDDFLNIALEIETGLEPRELLDRIKAIESSMGRVPSKRWGPRVIDIDIVLWGDLVYQDSRLTIPHSAYRERAFVLTPLAEIAPEAVDPSTGQTIKDLEAASHDEPGVRVYAPGGSGGEY